jgi:transposase
MGDLSDFARGQSVGARLAGTSVAKAVTLLGVSRATASKAMSALTNHRKTATAKRTSGRNSALKKEIVVHWKGLFRKITELLQH